MVVTPTKFEPACCIFFGQARYFGNDFKAEARKLDANPGADREDLWDAAVLKEEVETTEAPLVERWPVEATDREPEKGSGSGVGWAGREAEEEHST